jgi:phospholipid/cholesterol/gamma-HCH transport system ATP-binding protein
MLTSIEQPVLSVRDLVAGFRDRNVLDHLNLDVEAGQILGLVGGSGSGKSVLLRTILGLLPKRSGTIAVFGTDLDSIDDAERQKLQRRWGVLFQNGALYSSLTVMQNVQFPMREFLRLPEHLLDEIAATKLAMVGLSRKDANKLPSELSGGMTKRVAMARALALDPEVLFLDEPTSGLDPISAGDFDSLIRTLQQTLGLTVFMITHDLNSLHTVCDRIAVLADAKIVADGSIAAMLASEHPWVKSYFRGQRGRLLEHSHEHRPA